MKFDDWIAGNPDANGRVPSVSVTIATGRSTFTMKLKNARIEQKPLGLYVVTDDGDNSIRLKGEVTHTQKIGAVEYVTLDEEE